MTIEKCTGKGLVVQLPRASLNHIMNGGGGGRGVLDFWQMARGVLCGFYCTNNYTFYSNQV